MVRLNGVNHAGKEEHFNIHITFLLQKQNSYVEGSNGLNAHKHSAHRFYPKPEQNVGFEKTRITFQIFVTHVFFLDCYLLHLSF